MTLIEQAEAMAERLDAKWRGEHYIPAAQIPNEPEIIALIRRMADELRKAG
jgi:hypothetical protein